MKEIMLESLKELNKKLRIKDKKIMELLAWKERAQRLEEDNENFIKMIKDKYNPHYEIFFDTKNFSHQVQILDIKKAADCIRIKIKAPDTGTIK